MFTAGLTRSADTLADRSPTFQVGWLNRWSRLGESGYDEQRIGRLCRLLSLLISVRRAVR